MSTPRHITVKFTLAEWNATRGCLRGEAEMMDEYHPHRHDLNRALKKLEDARELLRADKPKSSV